MRSIFKILVLLFALSLTNGQAQAADRFNGQCRVTAGTATQCEVTVYDAGTVNVASIFSNTGLSTPKANPFTADANGQFFFYAANGKYDIILTNGDPDIGTFTIADVFLADGLGTGSVTSVAMTVPSILSVSGSPITTSGTLAVSLATQTANTLFAGPASGEAAGPTFRSLGDADIPSLNTLTTGLTASRCVETDGTGLLIVALGPCGTGSVTSVALTTPSIFTVTGSPITTSGTLAVGLATQLQNLVWASPDASTGAPAFRALVANDIPSLPASKITSGSFADAQISQSSVLQHEGTFTLNNLLGTLGPTKGGTGIATYTTGDILYSSLANTLAKLAGNTTTNKMVLTSTGSGSAATAPTWEVLNMDDLAGDDTFVIGTGTSATVTTTFDILSGTDPVLTATTGVLNLSTGALQVAGVPVVVNSLTLTAGVGLSGGGDLSANRTFAFDATELTALTWSAGGSDSFIWSFDVSGTDTAITFGSGTINVSSGQLQEAGSPVVVESFTLTGGVGIAAIGDLSANRTITFDATELTNLTWSAGGSASFTHTYNVSTGTDPVWTYGDAFANLSAGILQQGGTAVVLQTRNLIAGVGLSGGGTLAADLTFTFDATELDSLTWDTGSLATFTWTFDLTGTDPTLIFESDTVALGGFFRFGSVIFSELSTQANGTAAYCSDCAETVITTDNTCVGSGTGALAMRINNSWVCKQLDGP